MHTEIDHKTFALWVLRIGVAGTFIGHGVFAIMGKASWFQYFHPFGITDVEVITNMLLFVGVMDLMLAAHVLIRPWRPLVLWMAVWGLWTAMIRWPFGPDPIWDFVERWSNWAAPLALAALMHSIHEVEKPAAVTPATPVVPAPEAK